MLSAKLVLSLLAVVPSTLAVFSQGFLDPTRDYAIKYTNQYSTTEAFCREFRKQCVNYAGPRNFHHQLDCVFAQTGPVVRAMCAGIPKNADGTWEKDAVMVPYTTEMIGMVKGASIVGPPVPKVLPTTTKAPVVTKKPAVTKKPVTTSKKATSTKKAVASATKKPVVVASKTTKPLAIPTKHIVKVTKAQAAAAAAKAKAAAALKKKLAAEKAAAVKAKAAAIKAAKLKASKLAKAKAIAKAKLARAKLAVAAKLSAARSYAVKLALKLKAQ